MKEKEKEFFINCGRASHLCFMRYCWKAMENFIIGFHTKIICQKIDDAFENFKNGKSTYLSIGVHPRSGKSQIVSKYLPPHFLGECPESNVIMSSYEQSVIEGFSSAAMQIAQTDEYHDLYPYTKLVKKAVSEWHLQNSNFDMPGIIYASSLYSGLNGKGAHLAILDDYCKGREQAESPTMRDRAWDAFTNDFMTRLAPVHIVIILATSWNVDDIRGRIKKAMEKDPGFPKFEFLSFPARKEDYHGEGEYPGKYLFSERFNDSWYEGMYSILGPYAAASLMDDSPTVRGGNILDSTKIKIHKDKSKFPTYIKYARVWDLGHNLKTKKRKDPDPTGGTLLGFRKIGMNTEINIPIVDLWVKHYIEFTKGTTERDDMIRQFVIMDGPGVDLVYEATVDSIDTVNQSKAKLSNVKIVHVIHVSKPKHVRIGPLESVFAIGNVNILEGTWNRRWIQGIEQFDGSENMHDEMIDNLSSGYEHLVWHGRVPKEARW